MAALGIQEEVCGTHFKSLKKLLEELAKMQIPGLVLRGLDSAALGRA